MPEAEESFAASASCETAIDVLPTVAPLDALTLKALEDETAFIALKNVLLKKFVLDELPKYLFWNVFICVMISR